MKDSNLDGEEKFFAAFMAVACVMGGGLLLFLAVDILWAVWNAGFINFVVWSVVLTVFFFICRSVYHLIIRNGWVDGSKT